MERQDEEVKPMCRLVNYTVPYFHDVRKTNPNDMRRCACQNKRGGCTSKTAIQTNCPQRQTLGGGVVYEFGTVLPDTSLWLDTLAVVEVAKGRQDVRDLFLVDLGGTQVRRAELRRGRKGGVTAMLSESL
jgi:hypothetical protein